MLKAASTVFLWTNHARMKMGHYRLSEARIKRIIRYPVRVEEGILEGGVACMSPAGGKRYSEIWVMYILKGKKLYVITAWRYPGRAPKRDPVPEEVLREIRGLL